MASDACPPPARSFSTGGNPQRETPRPQRGRGAGEATLIALLGYDFHLERRDHVRNQGDLELEGPDVLDPAFDGIGKNDLATVDHDTLGGKGGGDVLARDRAEEAPVFAGLLRDGHADGADLVGRLARFLLGLLASRDRDGAIVLDSLDRR